MWILFWYLYIQNNTDKWQAYFDVGCKYFASNWVKYFMILTFLMPSVFYYLVWVPFTYLLVSRFKYFIQGFSSLCLQIYTVSAFWCSWKVLSSLSKVISLLAIYSMMICLYFPLSITSSNLSVSILKALHSENYIQSVFFLLWIALCTSVQ